ncbi:hypothetical protein [Clostridium sp.]
MYELQRMNVVRLANDKNVRDKLIAQGFKLIEKPKEDDKLTDKPKK